MSGSVVIRFTEVTNWTRDGGSTRACSRPVVCSWIPSLGERQMADLPHCGA